MAVALLAVATMLQAQALRMRTMGYGPVWQGDAPEPTPEQRFEDRFKTCHCTNCVNKRAW